MGNFSKILKTAAGAAVLSVVLCSAAPMTPMSSKGAVKKVNLRVMSFNVLYGSDRDTSAEFKNSSNSELRKRYAHPWPERKLAFKEMFACYYPEVAGFNEPFPNQVAWIKGNLNADYDYYEIPDTTCTNRGLTVYATGSNLVAWRRDRIELVDRGYFWLSDTPDIPSKFDDAQYYNSAIWCRFLDKKAGRTFVYFCVHTEAGSTEVQNDIRIRQARLVVSKVEEIAAPDETVFIGGDLNAANAPKPASSSTCDSQISLAPFYTICRNASEQSPRVTGGPSWNAFGRYGPLRPHFNIDHIFYRSSTVVPLKFVTVSEQWGSLDYISDHYPIVFDCKW